MGVSFLGRISPAKCATASYFKAYWMYLLLALMEEIIRGNTMTGNDNEHRLNRFAAFHTWLLYSQLIPDSINRPLVI